MSIEKFGKNKFVGVLKSRDKHVDVMLFWGILFVVMGHSVQLPYFFFPSGSFHMGLFFFISGYLFKINLKISEKIKFVKKKFSNQLIPYYLFNLFFFFVTFLLSKHGVFMSSKFNLFNFFVEPFLGSWQNYFMVPMWFLLYLFLINVILQLIYFKNGVFIKWCITVLVVVLALICAKMGLEKVTGPEIIFIRLGLGLLYFQMGIMVKTYKVYIDKVILNPMFVLFLWFLVIYISYNFGNIVYNFVSGNLENNLFYIPLITTTLIILISYSICYYISNSISDNNFLIKIGQNTFWIMALHTFCFFVIKLFFYIMGDITKVDLSKIYYIYNSQYYFFIYIIVGICIPTVFGMFFKRVKSLNLKKLCQ